MIKQVSVFLENREGRLEEVLEVLKNEGINIISLSLADTEDYGLLRMIVDAPEKAQTALKKNEISARLTDVIAVRLSHKVGQLQELLAYICKAGINIEYMYALTTGTDDACIVFKTKDLERASELAKEDMVEVVTEADLY